MLVFSLGFLLSLLISFYFPAPVYAFLTLPQLICATTVVAGMCLFNARRCRVGQFCHFVLGCFMALTLSAIYTQSFYGDDFLSSQRHVYQLTGTVANNQIPSSLLPSSAEALRLNKDFPRNKLRVKLDTSKPFSTFFGGYGRVIEVVYSDQQKLLQKGDQVRFKAKLNRPLGYENPFGFNLARWALANGIYARGKVVGDIVVIRADSSASQILLNKLIASLSEVKHKGFILPLIMAERALLSQDQTELMQRHGLSHLFAISGLHIGILFSLIFVIARTLLLFIPMNNKFAVSLVLPWLFVCAFAYVIGAPISAVRATILIGIWVLLRLLHGHKNKAWIFSTMLVVSLFIQPTGVLDVGWWLSMLAVAGIFVFNHIYKNQVVNEVSFYSLWHWFKQLVFFQCFITLWLLPVSVYFFSGVSISSLWLNLLFIPLFCFVLLPILFAATALVALGFAEWGAGLMAIIDEMFEVKLRVIEAASLGLSWLDVAASLALVFAALISIFTLIKMNTKPMLVTTTSVCMALILSGSLSDSEQPLTMRVLDVGQGTAVLMQRGTHSFLYDLGPVYPSGFSATEAVVKPNVLGHGITSIEKLLISHRDSDHFGDASAIAHLLSRDSQIHCPKQSFEWQNTVIQPLWPRSGSITDNDNDSSCVLRVVDLLTNKVTLLTGDISRKVELQLVKLAAQGSIDLQANVLFSAHHGSNTSSSYPFLKAVGADIVIHNTGVFNHFSFPSEKVRRRVAVLGAMNYSTSALGQILLIFSSSTGEVEVTPELNSLSSFWKKQNPFSFQVEIR